MRLHSGDPPVNLGEFEDGTVYSGTFAQRLAIGTVDMDHVVWAGDRHDENRAGHVDTDGAIWVGQGSTLRQVGRVRDDGYVMRGTHLDELPVGRVDPPNRDAGAALLLLARALRAPQPPPDIVDVVEAAALEVTAQWVANRRQPHAAERTRHRRTESVPDRPIRSELERQARRPVTIEISRIHPGEVAAALLDDGYRCFLRPEDHALGEPEGIDDSIRPLVQVDPRPVVAVVAGGEAWLGRGIDSIRLADVVVLSSKPAVLEAVGVPVVDRSWTSESARGALREAVRDAVARRWTT